MSHLYFAVLAFAFGKLVPGHVLDGVGFSVARITEMGVAPAEPDGSLAAELAFELDVVCAMDLAVSDPSSSSFRCTLRAQQRLLVQIVHVQLGTLGAVLPSHEVSVLALEALVIGQGVHCESQKVAVVGVAWLQELFVLAKVVILSPLHGFLLDDLLELELGLEGSVQLVRVGAGDLLLALAAVEVVEDDSGTVPAFADLLDDALVVHDVAAFQLDAWLLAQPGGVANGAELVLVHVGSLVDVHLGDAVGLEAGQALLLSPDAAA